MFVGDSLYGGGGVGAGITGGGSLVGAIAEVAFYSLHNGFPSPTRSATISLLGSASGNFGATGSVTTARTAASSLAAHQTGIID